MLHSHRPNWMTVMRIAITPLVAIMVERHNAPWLSICLVSHHRSVTDYVDGFCRRLKSESRFGEMLDQS